MPAYDYIGGDLHPVLGIYDYIANDLHPVILACDYIDNDLHPYFELRKDPLCYCTYYQGEYTAGFSTTNSYNSSGYRTIGITTIYNDKEEKTFEDSYIILWVYNVVVGDTVSFSYDFIPSRSYCNLKIIDDLNNVYFTTTSAVTGGVKSITAKSTKIGLRVGKWFVGSGMGMGTGQFTVTAKVYSITVDGTSAPLDSLVAPS